MDPALHWIPTHDDGDGIDIAHTDDGHVLMRHSAQPETVLTFTPDEWDAFTQGVHNGEFDEP